MRMKKNVLSWFGHLECMSDERMALFCHSWLVGYGGKVSGKRGNERPRLTFENTVSKIVEEGHVKSMRIPRRACMKRLMIVDDAKEVEAVAFGTPFPLTTPLGIQCEVKFLKKYLRKPLARHYFVPFRTNFRYYVLSDGIWSSVPLLTL